MLKYGLSFSGKHDESHPVNYRYRFLVSCLSSLPKVHEKKFIYLVSCFLSSSGEHEENSMSVLMSVSSLQNV
jgi:hypothetical protein